MPFHWVASPKYIQQFRQLNEQSWAQHKGLIPTYTHVEHHFVDIISSNNTLMLYQLALTRRALLIYPVFV
ncbi:hypothetical protein INT80_03480 [Gallibacterium anatis]|uniref:Uncharacterized protein n=1 Tax=Gallibacterium anatis TaxID=750 RepID=A0A930UQZ7_9PAST|nr:hypothetical protein [Gallibacterium anatis]